MKPEPTRGFLLSGWILIFLLGLLPSAIDCVAASTAGAPASKRGPSTTAEGPEGSCWKSHAGQIQKAMQPHIARQDSLSRQISLWRRSRLREAMEKQGTKDRLAQSRSEVSSPTLQQNAQEKAAMDELRALESQINKDPALLKMAAGLRLAESSADSAIVEILKKDPACADSDRSARRGMVSRANLEYRTRMAEKSRNLKRNAIKPAQLHGESK